MPLHVPHSLAAVASAQPLGMFSARLLDSQWSLNLDLHTMRILGVSATSSRTLKGKDQVFYEIHLRALVNAQGRWWRQLECFLRKDQKAAFSPGPGQDPRPSKEMIGKIHLCFPGMVSVSWLSSDSSQRSQQRLP